MNYGQHKIYSVTPQNFRHLNETKTVKDGRKFGCYIKEKEKNLDKDKCLNINFKKVSGNFGSIYLKTVCLCRKTKVI